MIRETVSFRKKTLISGGGIAGLTLAYWLHKYGHQPIVIEKESEEISYLPYYFCGIQVFLWNKEYSLNGVRRNGFTVH